ncbi:3417_t:CDS:2 [Paraglomus brasilianum]|uniref:3417_t:CDS:1 n=1 Tax=Paraglomus brasilianum TaxID=144538 RepID=A0A9N9AYA1_9GLOM|nr:3417_t:CDS:2 [Paraglomus brasilianum]
MRVVQKNLVYVIGLSPKIATEEILRSHDYFGQYGRIAKIVVNRRNTTSSSTPGVPTPQPSVGVYITYYRKEDAAKAIAAVDGSMSDGKVLRASYGTTKYCTNYLQNTKCQNPTCMYLHEPGEEADSYTKEDLASVKYHLKDHVNEKDAPSKGHAIGKVTSAPSSSFHVKKEPPHRVFGPDHDKTNHDDKDEGKPSSVENTPVLNKYSMPTSNSQSQPSTPHNSQHPPFSQPPHSSPPTQPYQRPRRAATIDVLPSAKSSTKKSTEQLTNATPVTPPPVKRKDTVELGKQKQLQIQQQSGSIQQQSFPSQTEQPKKDKAQQQTDILKDPASNNSNPQTPKYPTKQPTIPDFDQVLSALSDGSFTFALNNGTVDETVTEIKEKDEDIALSTSEAGVSRIVSPPPGVGFGRTDTVGSAINSVPDAEYTQPALTPYRGLFNPFASNEDKRFDPFAASNTQTQIALPTDSTSNHNNILGSPSTQSTTKSRHASRFDFAQDENDTYSISDPLSMKDLQEGFRALFPNVNVSFGPSETHSDLAWTNTTDTPLNTPRRRNFTAPPGVPLPSPLTPIQSLNSTNTTTQLDSHYQQSLMMQAHQHVNTGMNATAKIPPPGIYPSTTRMDYDVNTGWNTASGAPWNMDEEFLPRPMPHQEQQAFVQHGMQRSSKEEAQDFFGAFLKAASVNSNPHDETQNEAMYMHLPPNRSVTLPKETHTTETVPSMSFQDPAIMSVRLSNPPDSPYRTPSTSVVPQPHQQLPTIGGHRLSSPMMHTWNGTNSLSSKVARVSTEDFEKQAANAQRQAELLEHRLKTVIKKTAHHLPDAWKLDLVMEKDVIDSIYYLVEKLLVDDADRCGASPLRDASLVAECPVRR